MLFRSVTVVQGNTPNGVGNWTTHDAILNMVNEPRAAGIVLANDPEDAAAKMALAMDMALLLPDPQSHYPVINQLLASISKNGIPLSFESKDAHGFDGTAASLEPYILESESDEFDHFPIACQLVQKYPDLATTVDAHWGGSEGQYGPVIECNDPRFVLPASAQALDSDMKGISQIYHMCSNHMEGHIRHVLFYDQVVQYVPQALLPPYSWLKNANGISPSGQDEANPLSTSDLPPNATLSEGWSDQAAQKIASDFRKTQIDLAIYYRSAFDFSPAEATLAALRGAWLLEDAYNQVIPDQYDPPFVIRGNLTIITQNGSQPLRPGRCLDGRVVN